jgi:hypothetical protein
MKKLMIAAVVAAVMALPAVCTAAAGVTLEWDANTEIDLKGYRIHWGTAERTYTQHVDVGNVTTYTVTGLADGTWYFAATAYNTSGIESAYSNEVFTLVNSIPPAVPARMRVTKVNVTAEVQILEQR